MELTNQEHTFSPKHKDDLQRLFYAGFWVRFFAYIIDLIVLWGFNSIVTRPLLNLTGLSDAKLWIDFFSVSNLLTLLIFFLYFILMTKYFRATLGKMILGLSVESLKGDSLTTGQIIFRECIGRYISMAVWGLPYLVVAFTKKHQGIHDYFADTSVIKEKFRTLNQTIDR
ncbi:RDD family protein [Halobacillus litoralis]|uniref:RDD family protein n=1 Tax=Halobacillus litoralis TaxID=45668 RepID=UPI001CD448F6|nr:RDD family protein [Halobacillus litoralis]MCA0970256.1 RDD family protein [Halobacillus litoralis]